MDKIFYDKDGNIYRFKLKERIGSGNEGKVYKVDKDSCIKLFRSPRYNHGGTEKILRIISELDLENLYQIRTLLYDSMGALIGYTMTCYPEEKIDILTMPIEYTIDNMMRLYQVADALGNKNIRMHDLLPVNSILTGERIIIIDADSYFLENFASSNFNKHINRHTINYLFNDLYKRHLKLYHSVSDYTPQETGAIKELFLHNNPEVVHKKLCRYKRPIDYVKR